MSELLVFGDDDVMKEGAEWPVEVVGSGAVGGEVTLYSRESCKLLATEERAWPESGDSELPGREQRRGRTINLYVTFSNQRLRHR